MAKTISSAALRRLQTLCSQAAQHDLDDADPRVVRLAWASEVTGRDVTSFSKLTPHEGKLLIDTLQAARGIPQTVPARRKPLDSVAAKRAGTEGRSGNRQSEATMLDGTEPVFQLIQNEMTALGMDTERLKAFLRSHSGPNGGRETIRTLGDANRVHWALKRMAARQKGVAA